MGHVELFPLLVSISLKSAAIMAVAIGAHRLYRIPTAKHKSQSREQIADIIDNYENNMDEEDYIQYAKQVIEAHSQLVWARRAFWLNKRMPVIALGSCFTLTFANLFSAGLLPPNIGSSQIGVPPSKSFYFLTMLLLTVSGLFMVGVVWQLGFPPEIELEPFETEPYE